MLKPFINLHEEIVFISIHIKNILLSLQKPLTSIDPYFCFMYNLCVLQSLSMRPQIYKIVQYYSMYSKKIN